MNGLAPRVLAALFVFLNPPGLVGQSLPRPFTRSAVDVVSIDVSVVSRDRTPIRGLGANDFTVIADGKARRVVSFREVGVSAALRPGAAWLADRRSDVATNDLSARSFNVVVMDDASWTRDPRIAATTKRVARRVIESLSPSDLATVVFTSGSDSGGFTSDREGQLQKVDAFRPGPGVAASSRCRAGDCVAAVLAKVTGVLGAVPDRRKTVYLVAMDGAGRQGSAGLGTVLRLAQWGNVAIHAIDPSGLADISRIASEPDQSNSMHAIQVRHDALRDLAEGTGGRAILNLNDPAAGVPALVAEGESYYLIGFERSSEDDNGRLHPVEVRVNRKNATVRARRGYYVQMPEQTTAVTAMGTTPRDLQSAILRPMPGGNVALTLTASPIATPDLKKAIVALVVGVRHRVPGEITAEEIRTVAAAFDESGHTKGWRQESMAFALPADSDGVVRYEVLSRLELEPGRYDVRVALTRGEEGGLGSVFTSLEIPDYSAEPLSMSGLVLESTAQPATAAANVLEDVLPFIPTSLREFRRGDRARVLVRTYQGGSAPAVPVTLAADVSDPAGVTKFSRTMTVTEEDSKGARAAENVLDLPFETLPEGLYRLRVEATTAKGDRASRELRFLVN